MDDQIRLSDVPAYVEELTGRRISRATAYNWSTKGRQGHTLPTFKVVGELSTTKEAVRDFLSRL